MPSLRRVVLTSVAAALFSAPAAAQWFSERPAQCPAGTALATPGRCVKSSRPPSRTARSAPARNAPKPERAPARSNGPCPRGAYPVPTPAGVFCSPIVEGDRDALKACANFNAGFSGWYRTQVAEYEGLAQRHRDEEAAMQRHIDRQSALERNLRRQVFRARQTGVRRELTVQWNALRRDVKSNRAHLQNTRAANRAAETRWKKIFKGRLKQKLGSRPAGCKVAVAG